MKKLITVLMLVCVGLANSQTNETFVKGDIQIKYNSRVSPGVKGVADVYTLNVNVCNSAIFKGTISHTPFIAGGYIDSAQNSNLKYQMECDVVNPKNPQQTKNVGKIFGTVPINENGTYDYSKGNLQVSVNQIGNAKGFDSKFSGQAIGKPLFKPKGFVEKAKQSLNITKTVNGKTVGVVVKKYDKMQFQSHVLGAGPVAIYQEVTVGGEMIFDYEKAVWYFKNVSISYVVDSKQIVDKLSGSIRWVEQKNRKQTGEGAYEYDVRVNEPLPSENSVFAAAADESAFFETDNNIPCLTGSMSYKDSFSGDTVVSSNVTLDLVGNKLSRQQVMCLTKLLVFTCVVPINAE
jgi:hypothetical protein